MPWQEGTVHKSLSTSNSTNGQRQTMRVCVISDSPEFNEDPTSDDEKVDKDIIYEDRYCKLSQSNLILKSYYFPKGQQKRIAISSIQSIQQIKDSSKIVSWGVRENTWWNHDPNRTTRIAFPSRYFVVDSGQSLLKGFTVKNPNAFCNLLFSLKPNMEGRQSICLQETP